MVMNKKEVEKEIAILVKKAHDWIDIETLIDYGLSERESNKYYKLNEKLMELQEKEVNKKMKGGVINE